MIKKIIVFVALAVLFVACKAVPFTGRKQLNFMSNSQLFPMAFAQYDEFLQENQKSTNKSETARIQDVGTKIVAAAKKYLDKNGHQGYMNDYKWEFNLVKDEQLNAWCMPGGKVVFYEGIMDVCQSDAGIATVMGHEIAHALANHGGERMSQMTAAQVAQIGVAVGTANEDAKTQQMWMTAFGIGSQLAVLLPFSRKHESEADEIGLTLMTIAGYNPEEAISFWQRMSAQGGGAPPEFLSTHPSHDTRISNIKRLIPAARTEAAKY